jgi:hypothetical protein
MPRILVVNGVSHYDHIRLFTNYVAYAFERMGCECQMIDAARPELSASWAPLVASFAPDWFFSFNGTGYQVRHGDQSFLARHDKPFFTFMVDDPGYHAHWLPFLRDPNVYCSVPNKNALPQAVALGIEAHRCTKIHVGAQPMPLARESERTTDILFVGTCTDPELVNANWRQLYSPGVVHVLEAVAEAWTADLARPLHDIVDQALNQIGCERGGEEDRELVTILVGEVNRYVRCKTRIDVLRALKDLPLTIYGEGWQSVLPDTKFEFRPKIAYHQAEIETCRAKIVLNPQAIAIHGVGERSLGGMMNGALVATSRSFFFRENFRAGEQFVELDCSEESLRQAADAISYYLAHPKEREEVAMSARETALANHTWAHRAREVMDAMGLEPQLALTG